MSATGEYDPFVFPHKFSSGDYYFVYAAGENNFVGLLKPTPESSYTSEAKIPYEYMVANVGEDMLEVIERKNGHIYDYSDYICGEKHEIDADTYYRYDALENL